jgi:hypothetical protein
MPDGYKSADGKVTLSAAEIAERRQELEAERELLRARLERR